MATKQGESDSLRLTRRTEKRLIIEARQGSEDAARSLVDSHRDRLFGFVYRILRDYEESEEICQEAFLRAFNSLDSFSSKYRFSTWLFTIAYRLCLNHIRRRKSLTGEVDFSGMADDGPDVSETVAESDEARRMKDQIWDAVDHLSVPQRAAVLMYYREGMSCQAISEALGIPTATAKSHLHRARARLREALSSVVEDWTQVHWLRETAS